MPNKIKKQHLPEKICAACQRPFTWRKKWQRCWDEVRYCSKRCRSVDAQPANRLGYQGNSSPL